MKPLLKMVNRLLAEQATGLLSRRPLRIAVDYTLIPYHSKPEMEKGEIVRGKPKSGTTWFHAYATAYTILSGKRVTVALAFVKSSDKKLAVVRVTIRLVEAHGIEFRCFHLDSAFFTADIIHYIQRENIQFLMPAIVLGKRDGKGTRALTEGRTDYTTLCTMRSARTSIAETFPVRVVVTYIEGRQGNNKAVIYLHTSRSHHPALNVMQEEYRLGFEIESSHRLLSSSRIDTSKSDSKLRAIYVSASLLLVNAWAEKKWTNLSTAKRRTRGRTIHEDAPSHARGSWS